MPAICRWSRSSPLTCWLRAPASAASRSTVNSGNSGSTPSDATSVTSSGDQTMCTASRLRVPATPVRPGKSPIALRVGLDDGAGFDLTEAGTRKRLAVHIVWSPEEVTLVASLGVDPLLPEFTVERLAALAGARNQQVKGLLRDQRQIAGIGNAYSDEI